MYFLADSDSYGYLLAAPSGNNYGRTHKELFWVSFKSNAFSGCDISSGGELRPVVCLPSTVSATKTGDTWVIDE